MRTMFSPNLPSRAAALFRRPIFWIVVFCFVVRLIFIFRGTLPPVQFDARIYVSCALALPVAVTHPMILFDEHARKNISYDLLYGDVLRGETVHWLYYTPPSFDEALESVFFAGPVYPAVLSVLFWPDWWQDFAAARVANAVFDAVTCALLFWLLLMTVGKVTAHAGAALLAVYPGYIIKCGELNLEPISGMLTILAVTLAVSAIVHERPRRFAAAGAVLGLLLLTRAAAAGLVVFLAAGIALALWRERARIIPALVRLGVGFAVPVLPWVILVWVYYGVPGVRDPEYGAANFRSSNMLPNRGYDLDHARADFWTYPVGQAMVSQPGEYFKLYVEKFYRLWNRSYNDYRNSLLVGVTAQTWSHRLLVLLAIIGLFFWPTQFNRHAALVAIAVIAYVSVLHTIWHSLTRYALPVIPLVIGAAVVGVAVLGRRLNAHLSFSRWWPLGAAAILTYLVWGRLDVGMLLGVAGSLAPHTVQVLVVTARAVVLLGDIFLVCRWLGWSRRTVWLFGGALLAGQVLLWVKAMAPECWVEWSTKLYHESQVAERVIRVPQDYDWGEFKSVFLALDIQSGGGTDFTLYVQADSTVFAFPGGEFTGFFYAKPTYQPFLRAYGKRQDEIRQWVNVVVSSPQVTSLSEKGELLVRVWVSGGDAEKNYVRLFGDYRAADQWDRWPGPTFFNTSVERLYEEDDPRIWEPIPRALAGATNRRRGPEGLEPLDLSETPGLQNGDYRILILGAISPDAHVYF